MANKKNKFYAVRKGRKPGIYQTWPECQEQVKGYKGAQYKSFKTEEEAKEYINDNESGQQSQTTDKLQMSSSRKRKNSDPIQDLNALALDSQEKRQRNVESSSSTIDSLELDAIELLLDQSIEDILSDTEKNPSTSTSIEKIICYTDGACPNNGKINCTSAGIGVHFPNHKLWDISAKLDLSTLKSETSSNKNTNQTAEVEAIYRAIKLIFDKGFTNLKIFTDSKYSIDSLTKWYKKWQNNNWRTSNGKEVVHRKQFERILELMKKIKVEFEHVAGHAGILGNEIADRLAVAGAQL